MKIHMKLIYTYIDRYIPLTLTDDWDIEEDREVERNRSGEASNVVSETKSGFQCTDFLTLPCACASVCFAVSSSACFVVTEASPLALPLAFALAGVGGESFGSVVLDSGLGFSIVVVEARDTARG